MEDSVKRTTARHICVPFYGSFRKICRRLPSSRSVTRKAPKDGPQIAPSAVNRTDASAGHTARQHFCGRLHGRFRKIRHRLTPHDLAYGSIRKTDRQSANLRPVIRKHPKNGSRDATPAYRYTEASERTTKKLTHRGTAYGRLRKTDRRRTSLRHNARMLPKNGPRGRAQHLPISVMPPPSTTCECSRPWSISLNQKPGFRPSIGEVVPQICST